MQTLTLGDRIQMLRKNMKMSQKDFAAFLNIPQPSLSAYENNRNSPTVDVLINMANKCHISLDWLCGISTFQHQLSSLSDVADFIYSLLESNEIGAEIEVHDHLYDDVETETERWYTRLTFYGNDKAHKYNGDLCNMIKKISNDFKELDSYAISKEMYDLAKEKTRDYYVLPITRKEFPDMDYEELVRKRFDYLQKIIEEKNRQ